MIGIEIVSCNIGVKIQLMNFMLGAMWERSFTLNTYIHCMYLSSDEYDEQNKNDENTTYEWTKNINPQTNIYWDHML